ncbi:hypothetical protein K3495_g13290 [Podosphaera aphanis]|nr:hypothetical protein K3495_g13290 [Podosphaera aphanis]
MSSEMVIDNPAEQTATLEQLLKEVNETKDPSQFAQGANAKPASTLDLFQRLSERHIDYLHQKDQLNQANSRIQELERQNSEKVKKKLPRDNDALLRLVDLIGSKNNETRTSEIRDSDPFSGNKRDFNTWKESPRWHMCIHS